MLALIIEPEDYVQELQDFEKAARACATRFSLRFGKVTDPKLIKALKKEYGTVWFSSEV